MSKTAEASNIVLTYATWDNRIANDMKKNLLSWLILTQIIIQSVSSAHYANDHVDLHKSDYINTGCCAIAIHIDLLTLFIWYPALNMIGGSNTLKNTSGSNIAYKKRKQSYKLCMKYSTYLKCSIIFTFWGAVVSWAIFLMYLQC